MHRTVLTVAISLHVETRTSILVTCIVYRYADACSIFQMSEAMYATEISMQRRVEVLQRLVRGLLSRTVDGARNVE